MAMLSNRMGDYIYVSQGKTRIPGVNDAEEMLITDVSELWWDALLRAFELAAAPGPVPLLQYLYFSSLSFFFLFNFF